MLKISVKPNDRHYEVQTIVGGFTNIKFNNMLKYYLKNILAIVKLVILIWWFMIKKFCESLNIQSEVGELKSNKKYVKKSIRDSLSVKFGEEVVELKPFIEDKLKELLNRNIKFLSLYDLKIHQILILFI